MRKHFDLLKSFLLFIAAALAGVTCTDWDLGNEDLLPDPVTLSVYGVTDTTVSLRWTRSHDEEFKCYQVFYSTSDVVDTGSKVVDTLFFSRDTTKTVTGLEGNKRYYFRVMVYTNRNTMAPSNVVDTVTLPSLKDLKIDLFADTTKTTEFSTFLYWKPVVSGTGNKYVIYQDTTLNVDSSDISVDTIIDTTYTKINNLQRNKHYWFKIYLDRNGRLLAGSKPVDVITKAGIPQPVLIDTVKNKPIIGETAITLAWSKCAGIDTIDFYRYIIYSDTVSTQPDTNLLKDTNTTDKRIHEVKLKDTLSARIDSLLRNKAYYFTVFVMDTAGFISKASNQIKRTTLSGVPDTVRTDTTALYTGDTIITIRWGKAKAADFMRYMIYIDSLTTIDTTVLNDSAGGKIRTVANKQDTVYTIGSLKRNVLYNITVFVQDSIKLRSQSNTIRVKTKDGYPRPVQLLPLQEITDTSVKILWTKDTIDKDLLRYVIIYNDSILDTATIKTIDTNETIKYKAIALSGNSSDTSYTIRQLKRKTKYWFTVCVQDSMKYFRFSNMDTVTTKDGLPGAVSCTLALATDTTVSLRWSAYTGNDFKEYDFYYDTVPPKDTNPNVDTADILCCKVFDQFNRDTVITNVKKKTRYFFRIFTVNKSQFKTGSNVVVNYPVVIDIVVVLDTAANGKKVQLHWTQTYYPVDKFQAYKIYRSNKQNVTGMSQNIVTVEKPVTTSFLDTNFTGFAGDTAYYKIYHSAKNKFNILEDEGSNEIMVNLKKPGIIK